MKKFSETLKYDDRMDVECINLCNAMNSLPGIETFESCCGHGCGPYRIWFKVTDSKDGLFFLTRCVDHRYWKYGYLWKIELTVGDMFVNNELPTHYMLNSGPIVGDYAYSQAQSLLENIEHHLNHEVFMKCFNLNKIEY